MKLCFFGDMSNGHLRRVAPGLAARGHEVHVVCHKSDTLRGVTVERFHVPGPGLSHPYGWNRRWSRYLRDFLRRFDVVCVFFLQDWGFTPELMERGCLLAWPQGSDIVTPPGEGPVPAELIEKRKLLLRHARAVGAFGPRFAGVVADFAGLEEEDIVLMPLGVDVQAFRPGAGGGRGKRVGFFKGFRPVYGCPDLIRAMPGVLREVPEAMFELVGDGPLLEQCRALAGELDVSDAIAWTSRQPHERVPDLLSRWSLTVMPSVCESFGLAALESSAVQRPVVATDVGGLPDVIRHGQTGLLVPPGSPESLAGAIAGLLKDDGQRRQMGSAGRAFVCAHYDWPDVLVQCEQAFEQAMDRAAVMV